MAYPEELHPWCRTQKRIISRFSQIWAGSRGKAFQHRVTSRCDPIGQQVSDLRLAQKVSKDLSAHTTLPRRQRTLRQSCRRDFRARCRCHFIPVEIAGWYPYPRIHDHLMEYGPVLTQKDPLRSEESLSNSSTQQAHQVGARSRMSSAVMRWEIEICAGRPTAFGEGPPKTMSNVCASKKHSRILRSEAAYFVPDAVPRPACDSNGLSRCSSQAWKISSTNWFSENTGVLRRMQRQRRQPVFTTEKQSGGLETVLP